VIANSEYTGQAFEMLEADTIVGADKEIPTIRLDDDWSAHCSNAIIYKHIT